MAIFAGAMSVSCEAVAAPLPEQPDSDIGYHSVAMAYVDLSTKPGIEISNQNGWTIATDVAAKTIWSFAPQGDPSYPTVVRRQVVQEAGAVVIKTRVLCEATKATCDAVVQQFEGLNAQASAQLKGRN
ncbi:hypothetical protein [Phenylobacterium aquaticum]|uniref:hypothetical protein n=1 Tax=Phenylobacterium aquaticum TaxID=1763816 RepID=UPI001F5DE46F|nr:hypothetical protein [Phenylobacterium aquaticum]MCI3135247.1 hypothetical protein [Phenylobacterium aquaticum]